MPAIGVDRFRATILPLGGSSGDMILRTAVQFAATRPETPGAWTAAVATTTTPGVPLCIPATLALAAESQMWFRLGLQTNLNGGTPKTVDITYQAAWNSCGKVVDQRTISIYTLPSATKSVAVLTNWLPAIGVDAVKAAIELARVDRPGGTMNYRIVYQTADADVTSPGTWTALSKDYTHSDTAVNTGELGLDISSSMFVRFGLQYWQTTSDATRADVNITIGVRHDPLVTFGDLPTDWGTNEGGLSDPTIANTRAVYTGTASGSNTICDTYVYEADSTFTLAAYAWTSGNPSGPGAESGSLYVWVGYDATAGEWKVYNATGLTGAVTTLGTSLAGPAF